MIAVAVALLLLAESFGHDVIWLYRAGASPRTRQVVGIAITGLALVVLWFDLLAPDRSWQFSLAAFVRIPVEALVLVAVALVLPPWPRRIVATIAGLLLSVLTLDKILNIAMWEELNRPFNPLNDWGSIRPAAGVVRDAIGTTLTNVVLVAIWVGIAVLVVAITAATIHVTAVASRHRRLGAVRGPVPAGHRGGSGRLDQRRRTGRLAGARLPGSAQRSAPVHRGHPQPRPRSHHPRF